MKNLKLKLLTAALASAMVLTPVAGTVSDSAVVEAEASAKKLTKYKEIIITDPIKTTKKNKSNSK